MNYSEPIQDNKLEIRFKDPSISEAICRDGYYIGPLLRAEQISELTASYEELSKMASDSIGQQFWPSGRHPDASVRNYAKRAIERIVPGLLTRYVDEETTRFIGGTFLVKPSSKKSALNPHQDSSHVDERHGFSVYAWIPLTDTGEENGCFYYLPGSHLWGIDQRSLNVPWPLSRVEMKLWPMMVPVPMKAGQVLFFHSALIHASGNNLSGKTRVALNYYLHPKGSPFCHFYTDDDLPPGKVAMYSVTPDFYYSEDFESKPDAIKYPLLEIMDISEFDKTAVRDIL